MKKARISSGPGSIPKRPQSQNISERKQIDSILGSGSIGGVDYNLDFLKGTGGKLQMDDDFDSVDKDYYQSIGSQTVHQEDQQSVGSVQQQKLRGNKNFQISDTLKRAQNLLKEKQDVVIRAQQKRKVMSQMNVHGEDNMFMTGVGIEEQFEKIQIQEPEIQEDDEEEQQPQFDEEQYIKDLIKDENKSFDDLEELRRMIKATQKNIENYADDLYSLKSSVSEANMGLREMGRGIHEYVFLELDNKLNDVMNDFNKKNVYTKGKTGVQLPSLNSNNSSSNKPKLPQISTNNEYNKKNQSNNVNNIMAGKTNQTSTHKTKSMTHIKNGKPIYEI